MTIYAPYAPSYTSRTPYITAAEYEASATGVNVSQLVPRGTPQQNADALNVIISRASSFVDIHCRQVLAATLDTQSGRYRVESSGRIRIPTDYSPVVAVESATVGFSPSSMSAFTDLSNAWIDRKAVTLPMQTVRMQPTYSAMYSDGRIYAVLKYVNGYATTLTSATSVVGATTFTVDSVLGVNPGVQLTFYDPGATEMFTVVSVSGNIITVDAPAVYAHDIGVSVSALPPAVKQATVLLTSSLIKTRGSEAIVMNSMGGKPARTAAAESGGTTESKMAFEMLEPFVRVV